MVVQYSTAVRDLRADQWEVGIGTAPTLDIRTGAQPANCAASDTGTSLATMTLPSDWMGASSSGNKALAGSWSGTAANAGTAGHYRIKQGGTTHQQGTCGQAFTLVTSSTTAANGNVLTFASTTGVAVGQKVSGTGIADGSTVIAVTGTTVTLSRASIAGVGSSVTITFGYDLNIQNAAIEVGQVVTVTAFTHTEGNA